jgi:hypothetical protein
MPLEVKTVKEKQPATYRMFEWTGKEEDFNEAWEILSKNFDVVIMIANAIKMYDYYTDFHDLLAPSQLIVIPKNGIACVYDTLEEVLEHFQIVEGE